MIQTWDQLYVAPQVPSMPDSTLGLDGSIEGNGLQAGSLNGTVSGILNVGGGQSGGGYVRIDGINRRILVNDGNNDRILLGFQAGGF